MAAKRFLAVFLILVFTLIFSVKNTDVFAVDMGDNAPKYPVWANSTGDIDIRSGTFTNLFEQSKKYAVSIENNGDRIGSGFVWTKDGYILTNAHVVVDKNGVKAKKTKVYVTEKKYYSAIVGGEPDTEQDVALLKIEENVSLIPAPLGDSDLVRPGEWVYAIGSPFGLYQTVTVGVVSGLHRNIRSGIQEVIQTDVAINP